MEILKKDFATVTVFRDESLLEVTWHRQTSDEEFKEAFSLSLQTALVEELRYFLSDNSVGINLAIALQHWVSAYSSGIISNLKMERYARVVPPDAFQEVVSYKMYDCISQTDQNQLQFRVFYSKDEAYKWLLNGARQRA
ncbi:hypothetical protein [Pontibacter flavimaris]|uniref:STAS/SEC14 domain-containing protein n=1 Tax=Pontibacter flavimaris TaxID=1797110 RepID=A0A1Q5PH99_9BACT|nr:hypothetical protein [Pontibacter flavimaris]OKL41605.1 hypothetical protein A3841_11235 [Pontibacter flavimaris]